MDYEIPRSTHRCATTDRALQPGEWFYSVLVADGGKLTRRDYSEEAWIGPPEGVAGWWKSRVPQPEAKRVHWAPNDVMLRLFDQLENEPARQDMRYVLALLLIRRRVMRLEEEIKEHDGRETLVLYCPRRDATYSVPVVTPGAERIQEIQQELASLLFAEGS